MMIEKPNDQRASMLLTENFKIIEDFSLLDELSCHAGPDRQDDDTGNGGTDTGVLTKTKPKTKKPSMYKVLLLNDDYTPMEFVVFILQSIFNRGEEDAVSIMLQVHQKGAGICGVYPYEIAETKVSQVMNLARKEQHPLQCTLEKD